MNGEQNIKILMSIELLVYMSPAKVPAKEWRINSR